MPFLFRKEVVKACVFVLKQRLSQVCKVVRYSRACMQEKISLKMQLAIWMPREVYIWGPVILYHRARKGAFWQEKLEGHGCSWLPGHEVTCGESLLKSHTVLWYPTRMNCLRITPLSFPGGTVVKNPPANAGNTGLSPGLGRSHMPRSNQARAPQLLSLCSRARELRLSPWACVPQQEKPQQREACAPQWRVAPARCNWRKPARSNEDPTQLKINT